MATLTAFRAGGVCSTCGAYGRLWVNNTYGDQGATYGIGDDVTRDVGGDLASQSYVLREPRPGEPIRSLGTWACETCGRYGHAELVFHDGWLVDLRSVELSTAVLDRIHYIANHEAAAIEALLGRSIWDDQGLWPGWLPALREAVARGEAATPVVHEEDDVLLGRSLDGGRFRIVEHLMGGGIEQLWLARSTADPGARYLVSTSIDNGFDRALDGAPLMRVVPGLFTPRFVGTFDHPDGGVPPTSVAYVEQVVPGWPLPLTKVDTALHAFHLGAQVAEKLQAAVAGGELVVGLRPEYVWVVQRPSGPAVTSVGGRNRAFFGAARRRRDLPTAPLFTRRYVAPEVTRGDGFDERALVLTLAVMTAEWLLGRYPYEPGDGAYGYNRLCRGEHVALPAGGRELAPALSADPVARPSLAAFAQTLARLAR